MDYPEYEALTDDLLEALYEYLTVGYSPYGFTFPNTKAPRQLEFEWERWEEDSHSWVTYHVFIHGTGIEIIKIEK